MAIPSSAVVSNINFIPLHFNMEANASRSPEKGNHGTKFSNTVFYGARASIHSDSWVMAIKWPPLMMTWVSVGRGMIKSFLPWILKRCSSFLSPSQWKIALHMFLMKVGSERVNI